MSVSAELWKLGSPARIPQTDTATVSGADFGPDVLSNDPYAGLVRQVFVSTGSSVVPRKVLFLAADQETRVVELCEKSAVTLATISGLKAAVIGGALVSPSSKRPPQSVAESNVWRAHSVALSDRVWRLPGWLFRDRLAQESFAPRGSMAEFRTIFQYFLFATSAGSGELPAFAGVCDAAVLVVTANKTRKEVALNAKQQVGQYKLPLLGTVLIDRVFDVPETIYRRL